MLLSLNMHARAGETFTVNSVSCAIISDDKDERVLTVGDKRLFPLLKIGDYPRVRMLEPLMQLFVELE